MVVLARAWLGLRVAPGLEHLVVKGRVVVAVAEHPGFCPLLVVSAYLHTGGGLDLPNLEILQQIGAYVGRANLPCLVGADFQLRPLLLAMSGFGLKMGAKEVKPLDDIGSCRNQKGEFSLIDFSVATKGILRALEWCKLEVAVEAHPHRPVNVCFSTSKKHLCFLTYQKPLFLPVECKEGTSHPSEWPEGWKGLEVDLDLLISQAKDAGGLEDGDLDKVYHKFAGLLEKDVIDITKANIRRGARGRPPTLVRRIIDELIAIKAAEGSTARGLKGSSKELSVSWQLHGNTSSKFFVLAGIICNSIPSHVMQAEGVLLEWRLWMFSVLKVLQAQLPAHGLPLVASRGIGQLAPQVERQEDFESKERAQAWSSWAQSSLEGSAGKAHRFTKQSLEWTPTVALSEEGWSAQPWALLEDQSRLWGQIGVAKGN